MDIVLGFFNTISSLGASVMMPIIVCILGLCLGASFGRALRAGLIVGVGFIGLNAVIAILSGSLGPAVQEMVKAYNLTLDAVDIGWVPAAAIAFASKIGMIIIPLGIIVNLIMLITNTTQTVNVDIWNYWHFAFTGAMAQSLTGSFAIGVVVAALNMAIIMVIADRTGNGLEKYNGLPGISLPHGFTAAFVPIAAVFNKILDYIPGLKNVNVNMETIQKRMGVFGEPVLIGVVFGLIIGFLAKYEWKAVLQMAIQMGAALVLIPKMAALLMEGLIPISDAAQGFIEKRFKSRGKIFIGLDSAVGIGHPLCLTCALILVPLSIILAVILPGNRVLPFADLAVIPYIFVLIIPITKGDFIRSLIIGALTMIIMFYCGSDMVELLMATAAVADPATYANYGSNFSSICDGSNPLTWAMVKLANLQWIGVGIMAVITIALAVWNRKKIIAEAKTLAAEEAVEV